ncbi:MAG: cytochrome c biogenesis protein CcsA [Longimicrobiales bacterium]
MKELYSAASVPPRPTYLTWFGWFTLLFLIAAEVVGYMTSPADAGMGHLQKIMYVHVPAAWAGMLAFFAAFILSIMYFVRRSLRFDLLAAAAVEAGVLMTGLALVLGSIWGRATWGVWWTWEPRLTSTAIMFLMYVGYLTLRGFTDEDDRRARWSAAVGVIAFLNVPIVFYSVRIWDRGLHQLPSTSESMSPGYWNNLWLNGVAFLLVLGFFMASRYHVAQLEREVELRREENAMRGSARNG